MTRRTMFEIAIRVSKRVLGGTHQVVCSAIVLALETGALRGIPEAKWEAVLGEALRTSFASLKEVFRGGIDMNAAIPLLIVDLRAQVDSVHRSELEGERTAALAAIAKDEAERAQVEKDQASYINGGASYDAGEECPADADEWFTLGWSDRQNAVADKAANDATAKAAEEEAKLEAEAAAMRAEEEAVMPGPPSDAAPSPKPKAPKAPKG